MADGSTSAAAVGELELRPLSRAILGALAPLLDDADTLRFTRFPAQRDGAGMRGWVDRYIAGADDGTCAGFVALDGDGEIVGLALAPHVDRAEGEAELGYIVAPPARGRGVATRLLGALTRWAFAEGIERAYLMIAADNVASERVAARAGYVREGVMRSVRLRPGVRCDVSLWSRLPSDPPAPGGASAPAPPSGASAPTPPGGASAPGPGGGS